MSSLDAIHRSHAGRAVPSGRTAGDKRGRRLASLVLVAAACLNGGLVFGRGFDGGVPKLPLLVAVGVPAVVGAALTRRDGRPRPVALSALLNLLAWLLVTASGVEDAEGLGGRVAAAFRVAGDSVWVYLDTTLPAPATPDLLALPVTLTWLAAFTGVELAARTRARVWPVAPATALLVVAALLVAGQPGGAVTQATVLLALAGMLALVRTEPSGETAGGGAAGEPAGWLPPRRLASALAVVVGCSLLAALVAPWLPIADGAPYDPRLGRALDKREYTAPNPLDEVAGWLGDPDQPMFSVRMPAAGDLRLAVLDTFDGVSWTSSDTFVRTGGQVPAGPALTVGEPEPTVRQEITVEGLGGGYLPALDRPERVTPADGSPPDLDVSVATGVLAVPGGTQAGARYTVLSRPAPTYSPERLAAAGVDAGSDADALTRLPQYVPETIRSLAETATRDAQTPYAAAVALERYLRSRPFVYDPEAVPGHSYGHLLHFLNTTNRGTYEQFATTFAVAARVLRLPSRVVVGFALADPAAGGDVRSVRSGDARVWAEIKFAGLGWVAFHPTPQETTGGESAPAAPSAPPGPGTDTKVPQDTGSIDEEPPTHPEETEEPLPWWVATVGALLAVPVGYAALAIVLDRASRRRRRTHGSARDRVLGAWRESLDRLATAGCPVPASASPTEAVALVRAWQGDGRATGGPAAAIGSLAALLRLAAFAPGDVGARAGLDAWDHADDLRAGLRRAAPRGQRRTPSRLWARLRPSAVVAAATELAGSRRLSPSRRPGARTSGRPTP